VANRDAGDVHNRVGRSCFKLADPDAELPQARAAWLGRTLGHRGSLDA
jgi:hypothetical protein